MNLACSNVLLQTLSKRVCVVCAEKASSALLSHTAVLCARCAELLSSDTICSEMILQVFGGGLRVVFDHSYHPSPLPLRYFPWPATSGLNKNCACALPFLDYSQWKLTTETSGITFCSLPLNHNAEQSFQII